MSSSSAQQSDERTPGHNDKESKGSPLLSQEELQSDLLSLGRVSHRLAMTEDESQFESVVSKLLPRLLVRMDRNYQQQQEYQANDQLLFLLQQIQSKLLEILNHILRRIKQQTTNNRTSDAVSCQSILDLFVTTTSIESATTSDPNLDAKGSLVLRAREDVGLLTKNLGLAFLTVGVPKSSNPISLIPALLACLHQERKLLVRDNRSQSTTTNSNSSTFTLLILQCFIGSSGSGATTKRDPEDEDVEGLRSFLALQQECSAILYELFLDVLLWTTAVPKIPSSAAGMASGGATTLPPPGLSQHGQERLQQALNNVTMATETKLTLLEWIAPARKALFLGSRNQPHYDDDKFKRNLARTLTLLLVAKGQPLQALSERAQTYLQMHMQNNTYLQSKTVMSSQKKQKISESESSTVPPNEPEENDTFEPEPSVDDFMVLELVSLTLGQAQAEEIVWSSSSNIISALPLHCFSEKPNAEGSSNNIPTTVWASKRRAVTLTPTAATIWSAVATTLAATNRIDTIITLAQMVAFSAQKHLGDAISAMSAPQAKPYLALAQLMQAAVVLLIRWQKIDQDQMEGITEESIWTDIMRSIQDQFVDICCKVLKHQVTAASAYAHSSSNNSSMVISSEGSWAVREEVYSTLCHLCRNFSSFDNKDDGMLVEITNLLFGCVVKEHERLRPKAVAALDALLEALVRIFAITPSPHSPITSMSEGDSTLVDTTDVANPWSTPVKENESQKLMTAKTPPNGSETDKNGSAVLQDRQFSSSLLPKMAKSLLPLLWNAAQAHQPKASRLSAARWVGELFFNKKQKQDRRLVVQGCHLLCFMAGDADVTVASMSQKYLFSSSSWMQYASDDEGLTLFGTNMATGYGDDNTTFLPDFGTFTEVVFQSAPTTESTEGLTRVQRYWDFSFLGKAAALRFGLLCLMSDLYAEEDSAVAYYLFAMMKTLEYYAKHSMPNETPSRDRTSVDLLDQCCACLLTTVRSSKLCRQKLASSSEHDGKNNSDESLGLTLAQVEELAVLAKSSQARRHLAGVVGAVFEDETAWNLPAAASLSDWMSKTQISNSLTRCVDQMKHLEKNHFQLGKLHGAIFLTGHVLRAIRHRLLAVGSSASVETATATATDPLTEQTWKDSTYLLKLLGAAVLHKEEVLGNAGVDAIGIALSFDSMDAPLLDPHLNEGTIAVMDSISNGILKFSDGDTVDVQRATGLVRAAGIVLGATSLNNRSESLHKARHTCVQATLSTLGSMAFRKEEEIALVVGEALGKYADSCNYASSSLVWPSGNGGDSQFREEFLLTLPPQEFVLYFLLTKNLVASTPAKRIATAPALLGLVGRAAKLVHMDGNNARRSFIQAVCTQLNNIQQSFITLLGDPKIKHFSRESCCLGLAACRGLATFKTMGGTGASDTRGVDDLNQRLLRAFGQTSNYGGSAYQETRTEAQERRAGEQGVNRPQTDVDRNILEPFGMESEVGGAAGLGEAALGAFREMAAASLALGRPDMVYSLLILSISHSAWFAGRTRDNYNACTLLGDSSFVGSRMNTIELRKALRPHLGKLLPRILRACNDPNKQTREQMNVLWLGLTGGGAESRDAITEHFLSIIDYLIRDASNKLWRARAGATGALADVIIGRDWESFGGGPPVLSDDDTNDDRHTDYAGVRILRLWRVVVRSLDDVRDTVRTNGERLGRALRALTIRLCDSSVMDKASGEKLTAKEKAKWARDAIAASATSLRWLVKGLNQTVPDAQGLFISTLVELIAVAKPAIIEPSLPEVLRSLLLCMSSLEPAALNYLQLRTDNQEGLERARLQLAQSGPLATAIAKCTDLLPRLRQAVQRQVVSELDAALRLSAGFATRAAVADTASMICNTCPGAFSFPGTSSAANPSVRLMRAFYYASERERGQGAKDKMIHALGNLAALCPGGSVRSLAVRACRRYKSSTGNNDDPTSRRAAAASLRAIVVRASNQMNDGGSSDIWSRIVLPAAFLGQKDSDKKTASLMKEVWDDGSVSIEAPVKYGTLREEQLLPDLVKEIIEGLRDVSWERRIAGAKGLEELCDLGVLFPLALGAGEDKMITRDQFERSKRRAEACHEGICECTKVILKPRLWTGKSNVVVALSKLVSKWTSVQEGAREEFILGWDGEKGACPWLPVSMELDMESLFLGDNWFRTAPMDLDGNESDALNAKDSPHDSDLNRVMTPSSDDQIDFAEMEDETADEMVLSSDQLSGGTSQGTLTFIGVCRVLVEEALPVKRMPQYELSEEYIPYRTSCLNALSDLLNSVPSANVPMKSQLYKHIGSRLLLCTQPTKNADEAPLIVSRALDCLAQFFWDNFGSPSEVVEGVNAEELFHLLSHVSGKQQPAWTVRRSGSMALAALVAACHPYWLCNARVIGVCIDCATYACRDKKFWRVREGGLVLIGAMIRRVGSSSGTCDSLLLEALLPHKEDILHLLRGSLTDSEPTVTSLSSELLPLLSWWP